MPMRDEGPFEGGCTCGHVRYRMQSAPLFVHCCHCRWCQRETGSAFVLNAMIEADRVVLLQGEVDVVPTPSQSGLGQKIARCPRCHVAVWSHYAGGGDAVRFVRVGTLDEPDRLPPDIHIYTGSKQPWVVLPPGIPAVAAYYDRPTTWPAESLARLAALHKAGGTAVVDTPAAPRADAPAVIALQPGDVDDVVEVLVEAFGAYPVMRHVLGPARDYDACLPILVTLFASGRALRGEPMLGVRGTDGRLLAAALVTPPDSVAAPAQWLALRERTWARLGGEARQRYEAFAAACNRLGIDTPHHHLNMIGVRRAHQGSGLARRLLEAVHALADRDPASAGVSLTTEHAPNLALYRHFGYRITGESPVAPGLHTWTLFRARPGPGGRPAH